MPGKLYIVATPIGNLGDITLRALETLKSVSLIAAEDTRHTLKLLSHYDIHCAMISYHQHNRMACGEKLLARLNEGQDVALVTDAGMPCISDPGWELVALAHENGIEVVVVPGASAAASAVALSGLDSSRFMFEGFLPRSGRQRQLRIAEIAAQSTMTIIYEAPHRLEATLKDLSTVMPQRPAALCEDMTKLHERVHRGSLEELYKSFEGRSIKGEYVLVLGSMEPETPTEELTLEEELLARKARGMDKKQAVKDVALSRGLPRNEVYQLAIDMPWE